jgi:hypothetical protein
MSFISDQKWVCSNKKHYGIHYVHGPALLEATVRLHYYKLFLTYTANKILNNYRLRVETRDI